MLTLKRKNFGLGSWGSAMMKTGAKRMKVGWKQAGNQYGMTNRWAKGMGNMIGGFGQSALGVGAKTIKGAGIVGAGTLALGGLGLAGLHSMATDG